MAVTLIDNYRRWFAYEQDAHDKVFSSFATVPDGGKSTPEYQKAVALMGHIVAARRMWLSRLGIIPPITGPLFPENPSLDDVERQWREVEDLWDNFLANADDKELAREFEYKSLDAGRFRNRIEDILGQLFGHSWYHRGQIAMLIKAAGGQPAITDLIYWCREALP